jgi:hypothetical protein
MKAVRSAQERNGGKRAALRLAALNAADRSWILTRLDHAQRAELEARIEPLLALGSSRLAALWSEIEQMLDKGPNEVPESPVKSPEGALSILDRASPAALKAIAGELPWQALAVLRTRISPSRRHVVDAALEGRSPQDYGRDRVSPAVTDAFCELLVQVVEQRLSENSGGGAPQADLSRDALNGNTNAQA